MADCIAAAPKKSAAFVSRRRRGSTQRRRAHRLTSAKPISQTFSSTASAHSGSTKRKSSTWIDPPHFVDHGRQRRTPDAHPTPRSCFGSQVQFWPIGPSVNYIGEGLASVTNALLERTGEVAECIECQSHKGSTKAENCRSNQKSSYIPWCTAPVDDCHKHFNRHHGPRIGHEQAPILSQQRDTRNH